jgi:hypothetical protein
MAPLQTMILSGFISALATATALWSGAVFKRAFDAYHLAATERVAPGPLAGSVTLGHTAPTATDAPNIEIGPVRSVDQKGGVTGGYVGSVNQTTQKK